MPLDLPVLKAAREAGIPVLGELELAWHFCQVPVLAVSGTNGENDYDRTPAHDDRRLRGTGSLWRAIMTPPFPLW